MKRYKWIKVILFMCIFFINYKVYAKYILTYNASVNIKSAPFYFDAILDTDELEILNNQATANITIKNNNGTNYNLYNTNYTITLEGNDKFTLYINDVEAANNACSQTINGNSLINNTLKIKVIPKSSSTISPSESGNLKIEVTSPYVKTINIPIKITKEIKLSGNVITGGVSNLTTTFDEENNSLKFNLTTAGGSYEKINIPILNLEVGEFYQLYFDESTNYSIMQAYDFACTVQDKTNLYTVWDNNINAMFNYEQFTWKTLETGTKSNQCISFWATAETMYWIWDLSALNDGDSGELNVKMLRVEKDSPPVTPYVDLPNAYFKFIENTDANYASQDAYKDVAGAQNKANAQGTFFTKATYNEVYLRMETMKAQYEKMYVPIKNLTIGQEYTLTFNNSTTGTLSSSHYYGYEITNTITTAMNSNDNSWAQNSTNFINLKGGTETSTTTFTATAETMYWVWSFSKIEDFQWATVHVTNLNLTENMSTLSLRNMYEEEIIEDDLAQDEELKDESIITDTNTVLNTVSNTTSNNVSNMTSNTITNTVASSTTNTVFTNTASNTISNNISNTALNNTVSNDKTNTIDNTNKSSEINTNGNTTNNEVNTNENAETNATTNNSYE